MKKGLLKVITLVVVVSMLALLSCGLMLTASASGASVEIEPIEAVVDLNPATLNLKSKGKWMTCYIELPDGFSVADIDVTSIRLNGTIAVDGDAPTAIGDYDYDSTLDLMVKFSRADVSSFVLSKGIMYGNIALEVTGQLTEGPQFKGNAVITVRMPGDVNADGTVNIFDILTAAKCFGSYPGHSKWNSNPDENEDERIDLKDIIVIARNFGKTYP